MRRVALRFCLPMLAMVGALLTPTATQVAVGSPRVEPDITSLGRPVPMATAVVSPTDVWAVGYRSRLHITHPYTAYASHWDGVSWTTYPTPNPGRHSTYLADVDALSANDVWAVGEYSNALSGPVHTLVLHWDGARWTQIKSHGIGSLGSIFNGVSAVSPNEIWAVGTSSIGSRLVTLTERWDGYRWRVVRSANEDGPAGSSLAAVSALASDDVWAVGRVEISGERQLFSEHWNGQRWKIEPMSDPADHGGFMSSDYAANSDDVWAVGRSYHAPQHLLIQHWDGSQWTAADAPTPGASSWLYDIGGTSSTSIWAVGNLDNKRGPEPLLIEHWDGTAWSDVSVYDRPTTSGAFLVGVSTDAPDDAWTVGQEYDPAADHGKGRIIKVRLHWDGTGWGRP